MSRHLFRLFGTNRVKIHVPKMVVWKHLDLSLARILPELLIDRCFINVITVLN